MIFKGGTRLTRGAIFPADFRKYMLIPLTLDLNHQIRYGNGPPTKIHVGYVSRGQPRPIPVFPPKKTRIPYLSRYGLTFRGQIQHSNTRGGGTTSLTMLLVLKSTVAFCSGSFCPWHFVRTPLPIYVTKPDLVILYVKWCRYK